MNDPIALWYEEKAARARVLRAELKKAQDWDRCLARCGGDTTESYRRVRQLRCELELAENVGD